MRKILYGFGGAAAAADPIGDIEALLPAGSYFWLADDAVPTSGSGTITAWVDRLQSLDAAGTISGTPNVQDDATLGKRVVQFSGSSEDVNSAASITVAQPFTLFFVGKDESSSNYHFAVSREATDGIFLGKGTQATGQLWYSFGTDKTGVATWTDAAFHSAAALGSGASSEGFFDGASTGTQNAGTNAFSSEAINIGSRRGITQHWQGPVAAVILAAGDISSNIATIHSHFDTYYGGALP